MKPIHFITIMRFARDNNLVNKSFDSVVAIIETKAETRGVSVEEFLEDYQ